MEILQLKYFCHAAVTQNFSKTAKHFGVPPSDVSQSIKRLENELGCHLFDRGANSIGLNEKGRVFATRVSAALTLLEDAKAEVCDNPFEGSLHIAINTNRRIAMQAVEKFRRKYPRVDISVRHGVTDFEGYDLIIAAKDMSGEGMLSEKLICETISLAVHKDDLLASVEEITPTLLAEKPFVTMSAGENLHSLTERLGEELGFKPHIAIQSDDPFYIRRCVELGLGVAFFPTLSWKGQFSDEVVLREFGNFSRESFISRRADRYTSACAKELLAIIKAEFKEAGKMQN